ncbi:PREDICTED: synaptonemal complex central element protein 3 [Poecilia mexicana]|uniref:synaptonemal complex central element protein 3 n=1 Tax=Poecilia mexicana TaxID=48701 RepID=UPI00072E9470|nr:PREDICTED: synaptonemal complex central element protein 3 [Poecilia mexicana]
MEDSSCPTVPSRSNTDMYKLNKELERVIEDVEDISVQLTWMAYDMVTLRTGFEGEACMRELQEAYSRCRAAVFGEAVPQPQMEAGAEKADSLQSQTVD